MKNIINSIVYLFFFLAIVFYISGYKMIEAAGDEHAHHGHEHSQDAIPVTIWTKNVELFMEYGPLVKDEESEFLVHLTDLSDFTPIIEGQVILETTTPSGKSLHASVRSPIRPGIFKIMLTLSESGTYKIYMFIKGPNINETLSLKDVYCLRCPRFS